MKYWFSPASPPPRWLSPQADHRHRSHCWGCSLPIDSWAQERCPSCGWVRCKVGGHCHWTCPLTARGDDQA